MTNDSPNKGLLQKVNTVYPRLSAMGKNRIPFVFGIDFLQEYGFAIPYQEVHNWDIAFKFGDFERNTTPISLITSHVNWQVKHQDWHNYLQGFERVKQALQRGDSYLVNYTCENKIEQANDLYEIYTMAYAKYKFRFGNEWLCFSPESFVKVSKGKISTYPMKGTIDALEVDAANKLLNDPKEKAEHNTIVDLLRNDLSQVATNVNVNRFRYIEKVKSYNGSILQASSEILGEMPANWHEKIGDWLPKLLPAGSVSGAPKRETLNIIQASENHKRNFYTGIFGFFDGANFDTAVAIRFLENRNDGLFYKTGGGITHLSNAQEEYKEMKQKIYVPIP